MASATRNSSLFLSAYSPMGGRDAPLRPAAGVVVTVEGGLDEPGIEPKIILRHRRGGKAPFEHLAHAPPVERQDTIHRFGGLVDRLDDAPARPLVDDLPRRAGVPG